MRVAFVFPNYWPYVRRGAERLMAEYAAYLVEAGHQVDIITSKPGAPRVLRRGNLTVYYDRQLAHPVLAQYVQRLRFYTFSVNAFIHLVQGRYDVAHTWLYPFGLGVKFASQLSNTPYLYQVMSEHVALPFRTDGWLARHVVRSADHVAALSERAAHRIRREMGVPVSVLPPCVHLQSFQPGQRSVRPRVLFVSDLRAYGKGLPLLLMAWDEIHRREPRAVLTLAGPLGQAGFDNSGPHPIESINRLVHDPGARAAIEILGEGTVDDLPRLYAESWVTVLPSVGEAFGLVLVESLACGTPVVGSSYDGPGEIITDAAVGATVPLQDHRDLQDPARAAELAEAVLHCLALAADPATADRCRQHAARWDRSAVGPQLEGLYHRMVDQRAWATGVPA